MLPESGVKIVFGTATVGDPSDPMVAFSTPEKLQEAFDVFRANGGKEIDTARHYSPAAHNTSEPLIGKTNAKEWATISTKVSSSPGEHNKAGIDKSVKAQLECLQQPSFHINYLHSPDPNTPFEETVAAMDEHIRAGHFERFGLSNFTVPQVKEVLAICKEKGYTKPTAYQGQYNFVARRAEDELFPLLRQNGISFYAWSPAGAGVFSTRRMNADDGASKFFQAVYKQPKVQTVMQRIRDYGDKVGISGHEIALRWIVYHSALSGENGDAIVFGSRTVDQIKSSLKACSAGSLPQDVVTLLNDVWKEVEDVAPGLTLF